MVLSWLGLEIFFNLVEILQNHASCLHMWDIQKWDVHLFLVSDMLRQYGWHFSFFANPRFPFSICMSVWISVEWHISFPWKWLSGCELGYWPISLGIFPILTNTVSTVSNFDLWPIGARKSIRGKYLCWCRGVAISGLCIYLWSFQYSSREHIYHQPPLIFLCFRREHTCVFLWSFLCLRREHT